jgi:hypothetical protein
MLRFAMLRFSAANAAAQAWDHQGC